MRFRCFFKLLDDQGRPQCIGFARPSRSFGATSPLDDVYHLPDDFTPLGFTPGALERIEAAYIILDGDDDPEVDPNLAAALRDARGLHTRICPN